VTDEKNLPQLNPFTSVCIGKRCRSNENEGKADFIY